MGRMEELIMKEKDYTLWGSEMVCIKCTVKSDKSPDEFDSIEDFYKYASNYHDSGTFKTHSVQKPVWNDVEEYE